MSFITDPMRVDVEVNDVDRKIVIRFDKKPCLTILYEPLRKVGTSYQRYWEVAGDCDGEIDYEPKEVEG